MILLCWPSRLAFAEETIDALDTVDAADTALVLEQVQPLRFDERLLTGEQVPTASAAVVFEVKSGQLIYSYQGDIPLPPASTCKVLTAIMAMELASPAEQVTISAQAAAVGESSIYLREGEVLTMDDLLKAALIHSANDACYALAEQVAGSEALYVYWLNQKAHALGAYSAAYRNTNGLPAAGHEITAYDLAMLTCYCLRNPYFASLVSTRYAEIGSGESARSLKNTNRLLWYDEEFDGVKTGTTDAAGNCLIASKTVGDAQYVVVLFHSNDRYGEAVGLLDFATEHYRLAQLCAAGETVAYIPVAGAEQWVGVTVAADLYALLAQGDPSGYHLRWHLPQQLADPIAAGSGIGTLALHDQNGAMIKAVDLLVR